MRDERVALEIHLSNQPLREARAENRKVDVSRTPTVDEVSERIRPWFYRTKKIMAGLVGYHASAAAKIGVDRRAKRIVLVSIPSTRVRLPDLNKRSGYWSGVAIEHVSVNDNLLAYGLSVLGIVAKKIVV